MGMKTTRFPRSHASRTPFEHECRTKRSEKPFLEIHLHSMCDCVCVRVCVYVWETEFKFNGKVYRATVNRNILHANDGTGADAPYRERSTSSIAVFFSNRKWIETTKVTGNRERCTAEQTTTRSVRRNERTFVWNISSGSETNIIEANVNLFAVHCSSLYLSSQVSFADYSVCWFG